MNPSSAGEGDLAWQEVAGVELAHEVEDPVVDLDERRDAVADVALRLLVRGHVSTAASSAAADLEQEPVRAVRRDELDADREPVGGVRPTGPRSPGSR